jgi:hypothetical protein
LETPFETSDPHLHIVASCQHEDRCMNGELTSRLAVNPVHVGRTEIKHQLVVVVSPGSRDRSLTMTGCT